MSDGSIIATIIATHMPMNEAAAPGHVCPGIRIHAIDIVQPPAMDISPMADMEAHQTIVTVALAAKSRAETPKKARCGAQVLIAGSAFAVLIVTPPPNALLVAPQGSTVEPLVHTPQTIEPPRKGGIGVVDNTVLNHECAHAWPVAREGWHVGFRHGRHDLDRSLAATQLPILGRFPCQRLTGGRLAPVVVFDTPLALLLLRERDVEV